MKTLLMLIAVALGGSRVAAQQPPASKVSLSLLTGPSPYDLSGVGTGFAAGAWVDYRLKPWLLAEGGVGYFRYTEQFGSRVTFLLPEVGLRAGVPLGSAFPFIGIGAGSAIVVTGGSGNALTLHGLVGFRVWVTPRVGLRAEGRLRAVDPWGANMTDVTGGLSIRM